MQQTTQRTTLKIPSVVDESTHLPEVHVAVGDPVAIDLASLKLMNSAGIRHWIRWILPLTKSTKLSLVNCPMIFLNLSSIVMDVVPDGAEIESFILNYLHVSNDRELRLHVSHPPQGGAFEVPELIITDSGEQYEFDGMLSKTFSRFRGRVNFQPSVKVSRFPELGLRLTERP